MTTPIVFSSHSDYIHRQRSRYPRAILLLPRKKPKPTTSYSLGELKKRLEPVKLEKHIIAIEIVDKLTDRQIAAKVRALLSPVTSGRRHEIGARDAG